MNEAAILAARRNKQEITQDELRESIEKVLLGPERKSHILSEKKRKSLHIMKQGTLWYLLLCRIQSQFKKFRLFPEEWLLDIL